MNDVWWCMVYFDLMVALDGNPDNQQHYSSSSGEHEWTKVQSNQSNCWEIHPKTQIRTSWKRQRTIKVNRISPLGNMNVQKIVLDSPSNRGWGTLLLPSLQHAKTLIILLWKLFLYVGNQLFVSIIWTNTVCLELLITSHCLHQCVEFAWSSWRLFSCYHVTDVSFFNDDWQLLRCDRKLRTKKASKSTWS